MRNNLLEIPMITGLVLLTAVCGPVGSAGGETVCPNGMVSYWRLDEGSGYTTIDPVGDNSGELVALVKPPSWTPVGMSGNALYFSGAGQWDSGAGYVMVPHSTSLDITGPLSVEAWVRAGVCGHLYLAIVDKYYGSAQLSEGFTLYIAAGRLCLSIYSGLQDGVNTYTSLYGLPVDQNLRDNAWHHVVGLWDGASMKVYLDGLLNAEKPWEYPPASTTHNLGIGKRPYGWGGYLPFLGTIDEVAIYNRALTPEEIQQHHASGLEGLGYCCDGPDTDGDGICDALDPDDDNDGLSDVDEAVFGTDPLNPDTDCDDILDGVEVDTAAGSGCPDPTDQDSDDDGLADGAEVYGSGTNPCSADSDGDGIPDDVDPLPTDPEGTGGFVEEELRSEAAVIVELPLELFTGLNDNANGARRNVLSNHAQTAANLVAAGNYQAAINVLNTLLDRVDGVEAPPDWIEDCTERDQVVAEVTALMVILEYLL